MINNKDTEITEKINIRSREDHNNFQISKKETIYKKIISFIQFIIITSITFSLLFIIINFSSYYQIATNYFFPNKNKENALENIIVDPLKAEVLIKLNKNRKQIKKIFPQIDLKISPPDNRIIIPKIGKNIPIISINNPKFNSIEKLSGKEFEGAIQKGLEKGVIHYPGTAIPGQYGNFFVTGHSSYYPWAPGKYKDVFALLNKLEIGDKYYVYYNQKKYTYIVTDKYVVLPSNISVLEQPNNKKTGTLMTCTPVGTDLKRLIIKSEEI